MFTTLALVLPSDYEGGELLVRHKEEEARIGLHPDDPAEVSVPFFGELVRRWEANGRDPADGTRQEALDLAAQIRRAWPTNEWARERASEEGHAALLLDDLAANYNLIYIAIQRLETGHEKHRHLTRPDRHSRRHP